jgi:four helix bundle protein
MGKTGFRELRVWQESKKLAVVIYKITDGRKLQSDFSLRDQLRRSAVSIPSNIAEGDERDTDKEAVRFFYIAKGSLAELRTQLEIALEIGHLAPDQYQSLENHCQQIGRMLGSLIKARSSHHP